MEEMVTATAGPAIERLRRAARAERAAQAEQAAAILALAEEAQWSPDDEFDVVGPRAVRIGADGTPLVDEFLPLEVAAALGVSVASATWLVRDVVNLAARLPRVWQAVLGGVLPLWRARDLAQRTEAAELDLAECRQVDDAVGPARGAVAWPRLSRLVRASMLAVAPAKLQAQAERARGARYLRTGMLPDDPASSWLAGRVDTADARGFDALLDRIADGLTARGEAGERDLLRARALGLLGEDLGEVVALIDHKPGADERAAEAAGASRQLRRDRRPDRVYLHLSAGVAGLGGVIDLERVGPALVEQVRAVLGDRPIRLAPVVYAGPSPRAVDNYVVPRAIREDVVVRDRVEVFPFSSRSPRSCDFDHTVPYVPGESGQTRPGNLGPLGRRAHRAKTHGGWRLEQPTPGVFWWTSPRGQVFRISPKGTWDLSPDHPEGGIWRTAWRFFDDHTNPDGTWRDPP